MTVTDPHFRVPTHRLGLQAKRSSGRHEVVWVNEQRDAGEPYDIVVLDRRTRHVLKYVEVKASKTNDKHVFEFTHSEFAFAQREGPRYSIYRVYDIGSPDGVRIAIVNDVFGQFKARSVGLLMRLDPKDVPAPKLPVVAAAPQQVAVVAGGDWRGGSSRPQKHHSCRASRRPGGDVVASVCPDRNKH